jgi:hypothetical protein
VSNLEKGARETVRLDELLILSAAFAVPLAVWFEGEGFADFTDQVASDRDEIRQALMGAVPHANPIVVDFEKAEDQLIAARQRLRRMSAFRASSFAKPQGTSWPCVDVEVVCLRDRALGIPGHRWSRFAATS